MGAANSNVRQKVIDNNRKMVSIYASSPTSFNEDPAERQRKSKFKQIPNVYQCKNVKSQQSFEQL